jgi:predicted nucleic acid-binding protein
MPVYILDSSALLRYIDNESGADRVNAILKECASLQAKACISAIQWGEVAGNLRKRVGETQQMRILNSLLPSELEVVSASAERAIRAASVKVDRKIAYADAFALELALDSAENVLVTADFGFKEVADLVQIEFLPAK